MPIERTRVIEVLKDSYSAYYTIANDVQTALPLAFRADYCVRDESYFLIKSATIWGNEKSEHAYIFSVPSLDADTVGRCTDYAWEDALPRVHPHKEHQCTNVKVVFVADHVEEEAAKTVQKLHRTKNYRFGLHGFSNLLVGAEDLSQRRTVTNRAGHELGPYFKKLFAAMERHPDGN